MEFAFTEEQEMLRDSVIKLMAKHAPRESLRKWERERKYPEELYQAWADAGLLRLPFPENVGGLGATALDLAIVVYELSRVSTDVSMAFGGSLFCGLNVLRKGTDAQRAHWLPKLLDGSIKFCIGISEPDAGSDVGNIRTYAVRDGDRYIVNGQKLWTTGAGLKNSVICAYVKTDRAAHYRKGMTHILIDNDMPGVELRKLDMLGRRTVGTYEVFFKDVSVPADRVIGGEGGGWDCLMGGLQYERAVSSAGNCGGAQAVFDLASGYARERIQFGQPIGSFQAIGHMLADMETELEAGKLLTWRANWLVSQKKDALREITHAKLFTSEMYAKLANMGVQVMGGYGLNEEYDMQRYLRDSRSTTIAAGTSQALRNLLANLMGMKATK
jgi:alkylation response protein AidB-like acyl-CoA dehydrogenase